MIIVVIIIGGSPSKSVGSPGKGCCGKGGFDMSMGDRGISLYKGFPFIWDFSLQGISFNRGFLFTRDFL